MIAKTPRFRTAWSQSLPETFDEVRPLGQPTPRFTVHGRAFRTWIVLEAQSAVLGNEALFSLLIIHPLVTGNPHAP